MRKAIVTIIAITLVIFVFNEKEIYKKDIRNRLVIQGIGIDLNEDNSYTVTLQAIDTNAPSSASSEGASQPPIKAYKIEGDSIYTAIKGVTEIEGKIPLYSQNRIIILGKSITEGKMDDVIDFFVRDVENSSSVFIASAENTANEILQAKNEGEYISAKSIAVSINAFEYDAKIFGIRLYELINRYNSGTKDFALPLLSVTEEENRKSVEIIGTAIFNNTHYRAFLPKENTTYLNFLSDKVYNTAISFNYNNTRVSLNIIDSKTKRSIQIDDNTPKFKIQVEISADIAEISGGVTEVLDRKQLKSLKKEAESYIKTNIIETWKMLYENYESDASGLARLLYIFHSDFYKANEKNLDNIMAESLYEVEITLKIRRVGHEFVELI